MTFFDFRKWNVPTCVKDNAEVIDILSEKLSLEKNNNELYYAEAFNTSGADLKRVTVSAMEQIFIWQQVSNSISGRHCSVILAVVSSTQETPICKPASQKTDNI